MQLLVIYTKIALLGPKHSQKIRSIRTNTRSIRTPKSGVSGPIPGVSPGVSQTRSIRAYTRSFARSVQKPGVSGLIPGVSGPDSIFAPKTKILILAKLTYQI